MRSDGIRVAVRPRGVLECLDLAVLFCGRRPLAVLLATIVGSLPCALVNRGLFAGADDDALALFVPLLAVEAAWAAVPLTLYLGQSVFSDRFSWREAVRAFLGGLPAMVLFQGVVRGLCVGSWILAPFALVWLYYLDQIVLLERPVLRRVWGRRGAMNRGNVGQVARLLSIDALLLGVGTALGLQGLSTATALWQGGGWWSPDGSDGIVSALCSWHGQIAFWAAAGFITVFRFFTYLDARIRREGWDVELKLRAEETWAGVRPATAAPRRGGLATIVLGLAVVLTAAGGRADDAADSGGRARRALSRQSFPWYDEAGDRYRPLVVAPRKTARPVSQRRSEAERPSVDADGLGAVASGLMLAALAVTVGGLVLLVVRYGLGDAGLRSEPPSAAAEAASSAEPVEPLPAGIRLAAGDLLASASSFAEAGDFAAAAIHLHAWLLLELDRRGILTLARGKTNGQYAAEVAAATPAASGLFRDSTRLFEDAFFGRLPVSRDAYLDVWRRRDLVASFPATVSP